MAVRLMDRRLFTRLFVCLQVKSDEYGNRAEIPCHRGI